MSTTQGNKDLLFGTIPPHVWQAAWALLQSDDSIITIGGMMFWSGVALAASLDDPNYCDKQLLAGLAIVINITAEESDDERQNDD